VRDFSRPLLRETYAIINLARSEQLPCGSDRAISLRLPAFCGSPARLILPMLLRLPNPIPPAWREERLPFGLCRILPQALDYVKRARPIPSSSQTACHMNRYIGSKDRAFWADARRPPMGALPLYPRSQESFSTLLAAQ